MATIVQTNPDGSVVDSNGLSWPSATDFNIVNGGSTNTGLNAPVSSGTPAPTSGIFTPSTTNDSSVQALLNALSGYGSQLTTAQNLAGGLSWSNLLGSVVTNPSQQVTAGTPTSAQTQAAGYVNINGQQVPTLSNLGQYANYVGTYGEGGPQTLASILQQANLTGMYNGSPTFASQQATGYVNGLPTTTEQGILSNVINSIMSANSSPANPFTYISKLAGLQNIGPVASFLNGAVTGATGQTSQQLSQQPVVTNVQAAPSYYSSALAGSSPFTSMLQTALSQTQGSTQQQYNPLSALTAQASSAPSTQMQANLPTGWGTSQQEFNKLNSPTLQGAYLDAIQNAGGQNSQDFLAGMAAAAPKFAKAGSASISNFGNM